MEEALKADSPIYCYKLMDRYPSYGDTFRFMSPIMNYEYIPDAIMLAKCDDGFMTKKPKCLHEGSWFTIRQGFHSYMNMEAMQFDPESCAAFSIVLAKCRIPRGAYYWKGTHSIIGSSRTYTYDEYCSDRIEFVSWSEPYKIEWKRPKVLESHKAEMRLMHPELYGEIPRKTGMSILNGLKVREAAERISGYSVRKSYMQGDTRIYVLSSNEYGIIELRVSQGTVRGVTLL